MIQSHGQIKNGRRRRIEDFFLAEWVGHSLLLREYTQREGGHPIWRDNQTQAYIISHNLTKKKEETERKGGNNSGKVH